MERFASATFVFRGDKLALQRRDEHAPTNPHKLALFGGSGEKGETAHECAVRELREETSLEFDSSDVVLVDSYYRDDIGRMQYLFILKTKQEEFEVYEGVGVEWYSLDELRQRQDTTTGASQALLKLINKQKGEYI